MPGPSTQALLSAWEQGQAEPQAIGRALALLAVASPDITGVSIAELSIGKRDDLLLRLRDELFGSRVSALAVCGGCGENVELGFDVSEVCAPAHPPTNGVLSVCRERYRVEIRLPNSRDLLALSESEELAEKRMQLLERIVIRAECSDCPIRTRDLPEELISVIEHEIQAADPAAELSLRLHCQSCGHEWSALFDIGSFLWKEVDAWAVRLLHEVHLLARAYGWREADILAMTPWRRHAYLEMLST